VSSAPNILLVHGAWHGAWCWERQFAPWLRERGFAVECLDLPGHGVPGPKRIPWLSVSDYADAVVAAIERSPGPVVVAGHSMGGFVVQHVMARRPANLMGAGLVASAPPRGVVGVVLHLLKARPVDFLRTVFTFDLYQLVKSRAAAQAMFYSERLPPAEVDAHWRALQNESYRAFLDMLMLDLPQPGRVDPALPKWVVGGALDTIFPPPDIEATARTYGVEGRIYPGMAHNLMLDIGWQQVAEDFAAWISTLRQTPG
jgi:alpha-beta hydrolase superfamily lysophospholipase